MSKNTISDSQASRHVPPMDEAGFAKRMSELHSEIIRRGRQRKIEQGGLSGCAPVGYVNRRQGDTTWVEIDPVKGPLVREAFEMAARGMPLRAILVRMNDAGLTGARGRSLSLSTLQHLLRNSFYTGTVHYLGREVQGSHAPVVDSAVFARAQAGLWNRQRPRRTV